MNILRNRFVGGFDLGSFLILPGAGVGANSGISLVASSTLSVESRLLIDFIILNKLVKLKFSAV